MTKNSAQAPLVPPCPICGFGDWPEGGMHAARSVHMLAHKRAGDGSVPSPSPSPRPSVGRVVHYVSHGTPVRADGSQAFESECRAAIVTEVTEHPDADGTVGLCVLNPTGLFLNRGVPHAEDKAAGAPVHPGGSWHWPERVEE